MFPFRHSKNVQPKYIPISMRTPQQGYRGSRRHFGRRDYTHRVNPPNSNATANQNSNDDINMHPDDDINMLQRPTNNNGKRPQDKPIDYDRLFGPPQATGTSPAPPIHRTYAKHAPLNDPLFANEQELLDTARMLDTVAQEHQQQQQQQESNLIHRIKALVPGYDDVIHQFGEGNLLQYIDLLNKNEQVWLLRKYDENNVCNQTEDVLCMPAYFPVTNKLSYRRFYHCKWYQHTKKWVCDCDHWVKHSKCEHLIITRLAYNNRKQKIVKMREPAASQRFGPYVVHLGSVKTSMFFSHVLLLFVQGYSHYKHTIKQPSQGVQNEWSQFLAYDQRQDML